MGLKGPKQHHFHRVFGKGEGLILPGFASLFQGIAVSRLDMHFPGWLYKRNKHTLWVAFFTLAAIPAFGGISSKGTEFWLAFPQGSGSPSQPATLQLFITSDTNNSGQVQIPGLGFTAPFSVAAGASTQIVLPGAVEAKMPDGTMSLGIHVTALNQVSVYALNYVQFASDGYLGLP